MNRSLRIALALLLLTWPAAQGFTAPTAAIKYPVSQFAGWPQGGTYNTRPWIFVIGTDGTYNIEDVCIQIASNSNFSSIVYQAGMGTESGSICGAGNLRPVNFSPTIGVAGVASGTVIKHRIPASWGTLSAGTYYVRAYVWNTHYPGGDVSPASPYVGFAVLSPEPTAVSAGNIIHAGDFTAMRAAIDNVRQFLGLGAYASYTNTPAGGVLIHTADITQMRTAFQIPQYAILGSSFSPTYTGAAGTIIHAADLNDFLPQLVVPYGP